MSGGGKIANLPLEQLRALFRACREEGVMQLATPELSFTLGPKPPPETVPRGEDGEPKKLTPDEQLDKDLFE